MSRNRPGGLLRLAVAVQLVLFAAAAGPHAALAVGPSGLGSLPDRDYRAGSIQPSAAQRIAAQRLGARASWNRFGTPQSLIKFGGWLAQGLSGSPEMAARNWLRNNRALFRLSDADVTNLQQIGAPPLRGTAARAVIFRQRYGSLPAGHDGLIIVGIKSGNIAYVSSSSSGSMAAPQSAALSPTQAWLKAAAHIGHPATAASLSNVRTDGSWTVFSATGFGTPAGWAKDSDAVDQRSRLVAVPTFQNGVRPAYETIVLDIDGAEPVAYTVFVDAASGEVLMRLNRVDHAADEPLPYQPDQGLNEAPSFGQFSDSTDATSGCGPDHPIEAPVGTRTIDIVASATNPVNDIVLYLLDSAHNEITHTDTGTSPEAVHWDFPAPVAGTFYARVCEFNAGDPPFTYEGAWATNDVVSTGTDFQYPPKWKWFLANPSLADDPPPEQYDLSSNDTRLIGCWVTVHNGTPVPECSSAVGKLQNLASRVPWDHIVQSNTPSYTTIGNNAVAGEAWTTPLTPGPLQQRPVHPDRRYVDDWQNIWNQERCNPAVLTPGGNDINAAVTSLFANHNRMHDWSYFLGFTEDAWNLQENNFGNNPGFGQEHDPEYGQVQSAAVSGGPPGFLGRDNANQITLNDGIPGITNMYLWQPIAGAFYAPCVDGDYDMSVIGHEYTHAISNRMAGGPDANLSGTQARAMGESWSDLAAVEYLNEYSLVPTNDENRYTVGSYVTGNKQRGIRNYNMSTSPLNYSDVGYDFVCQGPLISPDLEGTCPDGRTQVHADGEIWSAANYDIRQALINKYNGSYPASNKNRQRACAEGTYPATSCPGNRRWMQIMFDAWLLMPGAVSMLDARDAYLAADMLRFNGANQKVLWREFARNGFGADASTTGPSDVDPVPSFRSPLHSPKTVKFRVRATDEGNALIPNARIYVGHYEAGVTPIADTDAATPLTDTARFTAGEYEFLVVAPGYGHLRFPRRFTSGGSITLDVNMATNRASLSKGAVALGTGTDVNNLIDDTELTNWSGTTPVDAQLVTVDLQGGVQNVTTVNVSAMLNPENGGRFRALRQFEIWTCNGDAATCANPLSFTKIYTSPQNAFPGVRPRPTAPDLILRSFDVPDTNATHVQLRVVSNQCTATGTGFRGDQDDDPINDTDCVTGSTMDDIVRAAELQVFSSMTALPPEDPAVVVTVTAPATAPTGSKLTYSISYTNAGPAASTDAKLKDVLPAGLKFVSASDGGTYNSTNRTVKWNLGTINVGYTGTRTLVVKITAAAGAVISNSATVTAPLTTSVSLPAVTTVTP